MLGVAGEMGALGKEGTKSSLVQCCRSSFSSHQPRRCPRTTGILGAELLGQGDWYSAPLPVINGEPATYFGVPIPLNLGELSAIVSEAGKFESCPASNARSV